MVLEIIIFGAVTGIIVIIGRKLPLAANSSHFYKVPNSVFVKDEKPGDRGELTKSFENGIIKLKDEDMTRGDNLVDDQSSASEKELDEILKNIDFLGDNNDDDFWEPTFFEDDTQKEDQENKKNAPKKFVAKVKNIDDGYEVSKENIVVEPKKQESEIKTSSLTLKEENLVPKKILPKTPIGIGLTTNLTLRDLLVQANNSFAAKNFLKAEEFYVKAASFDPNNPKIYSRLGIIYLKQGKYHDAKESLKYAISLDDSTATHFFNISLACMKLGEFDEAISLLKKAVSLEPDNPKYQDILKQIS